MTLKAKWPISETFDYLEHINASGKLYVAWKIARASERLSYVEDVSRIRLFVALCSFAKRFIAEFVRFKAALSININWKSF